MASRKTGHNSLDNNNDALRLAHSYVRDFTFQANVYRSRKTDESLMHLNRSASLLSTAIQPQYFVPSSVEISQFFVDLHNVIGNLNPDCDALWECIAVLQNCCRNLEVREALVREFRFVPLLTFLLKRVSAVDRIQRLLVLLQELTYGIEITWEEPYVNVLLEEVINILYNYEDEEVLPLLALSVLINLCCKNFAVLFLFLRTVNVSTFSRRIQKYGMLANKMLIILSDDIFIPDIKELHLFLRSTFATVVDDSIKRWNVPQLRHIIEFLLDSKSHVCLHSAMCSYEHYCDDMERVMDLLDVSSDITDITEDFRKQQQTCLNLIFQLIRYILELSNVPNDDGSVNMISLDAIIPRIFEFACGWVDSDTCGVEAINLITSLMVSAKNDTVVSRIARDPTIVTQLIATSEKSDITAQHNTAVIKFLLTLLQQSRTQKLVLSKITESYFDKIFTPLLTINLQSSAATNIAFAKIETFIYCLLLIVRFADIAKKAYHEKCCTLLQTPQTHYALSRAIHSGNEAVCSAVFQISQINYFPLEQVAKQISILNAMKQIPTIRAPENHWHNINSILKSHQTIANKDTEERLSELIKLISNANANKQLNNIETSQIIELFNYKLEKLNRAEEGMRFRLEDASNEITNLSQRINMQNAELERYHTMNFQLHVNQEGLQSHCKDLKQQRDNLKNNITDLMKKVSEQTESLQISEKRLNVKASEVIALQKNFNDVKKELQARTEELEKLQNTSKENILRIDKLKKTLAAFEVDIKEKVSSLEEKDRELAKTHKALDEQKESRKKCEGFLTVLESQLQEKNEQIRSYETELAETEELRKTIMSLMESKKPKRK